MSNKSDPLQTWKNDPHHRLLQAEIAALDDRLEHDSAFGMAVRKTWEEHTPQDTAEGDQQMAFYRKVLEQMMHGKLERIVTPDPITDIDSFGATLAQMNMLLDRKFAEVRAISELTYEVGSGLFIDDVMGHIYETFHNIVPYDQIDLSLAETAEDGTIWLRSEWSHGSSDIAWNEDNAALGYTVPLKASFFKKAAQTGNPVIIPDLQCEPDTEAVTTGARLAFQNDARGVLVCPLKGRDGLFGFLTFSSAAPMTYSEEHAVVLSAMLPSLTYTLEKSHLYEDLTARNRFIRRVFGRYISNEIANALLEDPTALNMGGRQCTVTILMSDLRGFTSMSENMSPEQIVTTLNTFFNTMVRIIHNHNGTIDNIIGDAIMVLFGAPLSHDDDPWRAVECALDMQAAMTGVNRNNVRMNLPELSMGIGINSGDVVAGNIGSLAHAKYSVIGAPVNLAARLESNAAPGEILLSSAAYQAVKRHVNVCDKRKIYAKGFSQPVTAYSIERRAEPEAKH